jgi:hypothetical protein
MAARERWMRPTSLRLVIYSSTTDVDLGVRTVWRRLEVAMKRIGEFSFVRQGSEQ